MLPPAVHVARSWIPQQSRLCCTHQPDVRSKRRKRYGHIFNRHLSAKASHQLLHITKKKITAAHHAASQADDLGRKQGGEVSQPEAEIMRLVLDCTQSMGR